MLKFGNKVQLQDGSGFTGRLQFIKSDLKQAVLPLSRFKIAKKLQVSYLNKKFRYKEQAPPSFHAMLDTVQ